MGATDFLSADKDLGE